MLKHIITMDNAVSLLESGAISDDEYFDFLGSDAADVVVNPEIPNDFC
jgi:DNA-binding ferritin-like protein (Dps family)